MGIPVKLEVFQGPLDLLLHLIEKNKVNIYDIPIVEITDQYMEYVRQMQGENLEVMSEFLVMAATLLDIKSRMLLPPEKDEEGEEQDPRAELVQKLLEYKMYKYMSYELRERQEDAAFTLYKEPTIPEEVKAYRQPVDVEELLAGVTVQELHRVFRDIMRRQEDRIDPIRSKFGTLEKEEVDLNETMGFVTRYIAGADSCTFRQLLTLRKGKLYVIVTFMTLLELMKEGKVEVRQEGTFQEIYIQAAPALYEEGQEVSLEEAGLE
ncbi:MAG TPA: segregation/condensation protein A [Candidatus Choladousia intestinavium]|uniref:Segregation and condensation protein A n=1 Tax=Candidatus Choladousia intestinavium TaxID=2840727 RepID=A0A9D1DA55_9FIRM|nr:segregation/condensation protein A [Candidatus Choladousia intestinavium]